MKALLLNIQKLWLMLKFLQTNKQTNGRAKNYMPLVYQCEGIKIYVKPESSYHPEKL